MPKLTAQERVARLMSEASLQANVIELAEALGYTVAHIRDSRAQQVVGYPDLVVAGHRRIIHAELKVEHGKLTPAQELWRGLILDAGHDWYLWRPSSWLDGTIERVLKEEIP